MTAENLANQKLYVTKTGLPLTIVLHWPFHPSNSGADYWVLHSEVTLVSDPTLGAKVSVNMAVTLREALVDISAEKVEAPVINCLRKEVDNHQAEFVKSGKLVPVNFGSRHYNTRTEQWAFGAATPGDAETLLRRKAYWQSKIGGGASDAAWMADPADAQYLATTTAELMNEARKLEAAGLVKLEGEYATATPALLAQGAEIEGEAAKALEELQLKHAYERG